MRFLTRLTLGMIGLTWFFGASAQAVVITQLTGFADFTSTTTFTQDFESTPLNTTELTFDPTVQQFSAGASTGGVTSSGSFVGLEFLPDAPLTVAFSVDAFEVGLFFGNDDFFLVFDAVLEVFDGANNSLGSVSVSSNANDFADQFLGLRSDTAIRRAEISYQRPEAQLLAVAIDDFTISTDAVVAVPEPAALSLLGFGALALGFLARRRKKPDLT